MTAAMAELVGRAQQGDTEAHGLIYEQYRGMVFCFIHRRVQWNNEVAEDLMQDTFVRAINALKREGGFTWQGRDLGAWLCTIARNLVFDRAKKHENRKTIAIADYDASIDGRTVLIDATIEGNPEAAVLDGIEHAELRTALQRLRPVHRDCLTYRYLHQLSVAETAAAMGSNEGAVKAMTHRALRAARKVAPQ